MNKEATVAVPVSFLRNVLGLAKGVSEFAQSERTAMQKVGEEARATAEILADRNLIDPMKKEASVSQLSGSHSVALKCARAVAQKVQPWRLGGPEKKASVATGGMRASEVAYRSGLLGG